MCIVALYLTFFEGKTLSLIKPLSIHLIIPYSPDARIFVEIMKGYSVIQQQDPLLTTLVSFGIEIDQPVERNNQETLMLLLAELLVQLLRCDQQLSNNQEHIQPAERPAEIDPQE
jgi:hypothetical protein